TGTFGFSGDGGPARSAQLWNPAGIALNRSGNLYIADQANFRVRRVDSITGIITTVVGTGVSGYSGDGGLGVNAQIGPPLSVRLDSAGNLYISNVAPVRKLNVSTGIITTVAGNGGSVYNGDGIPATSAALWCPVDTVVDEAGNFWIADSCNERIRKVTASTGL